MWHRCPCKWIAPVLAAVVWTGDASQAQPVVIHDSGDTEPLAPFLDVLAPADASPGPTASATPALGAADPKVLLPIRSPGLTPGDVARRPVGYPLLRPFFLIGSDARSKAWLAAHGDRLRELGAVGMLVEAKRHDDLAVIARLGHGLSIMPASGSDIARVLGIRHYPVLISREGIEQ